jgi:uncharacterized protein (DUF2141 family)
VLHVVSRGLLWAVWRLALCGQDPDVPKLSIAAENVRSAAGVVGVLVFDSARGWPEDFDAAVLARAEPARRGVTTVELGRLPRGTYAVVVLHDENENRKLDRGLLGRPKEGWGMSNNPKARLSAPSFGRASFRLAADTRLRIRLNY